MPFRFLSPPAGFVGRDDYLGRFKARLEHFGFFLYGGIAGIGKTALILRLSRETRAIGLRGVCYVPLYPGENIASLLARVEAQSGVSHGPESDRQGDLYSRLIEFLDARRLALVLDDVHYLKREDLLSVIRAGRTRRGHYRIIAAGRGDQELPAIDSVEIHVERVGPLNADEVRRVTSSAGVRGEAQERLVADAARGGCAGHPLTLRYMLSLCGNEPLGEAFFVGQSSRSVNAFRALSEQAATRWEPKELEVLRGLSRVGMPLSKAAAVRAFGAPVVRLLKRAFLSLIDDDVYVHDLVSQVLVPQDYALPDAAARIVAKHLKDRGISESEPLRIIRASELLASSGSSLEAVNTLTSGWESSRDFPFVEAFLKCVSSIPATPSIERRLRLLAARARMRQGNLAVVREELESLAHEPDNWTQARALAALTQVYAEAGEHNKVVRSFRALKPSVVGPDLYVAAGTLAAASMVRFTKTDDAEKLARALLTRIKGDRRFLDREGELRRLLARVFAQAGRLTEAVDEAQLAAKAFEASGDLYHGATAYGFIGDIYRETGDFELAKAAFMKFHDLAVRWGDRDLVQVADLADAWVSLDIGDLTHAARQINAVEKDLSPAPSRRLKRYLAAARALLDAGRGKHQTAAEQLARVIEVWDSSAQKAVADILRAQEVRSLIAANNLDQARLLVDQALKRLDVNTQAPRVAMFLRESALIRLRRKDVKRAMEELTEARKLFARGGNRREEALTLYRIAHAAFEEGDIELAQARVDEADELAKKIKHARAIAQCMDLQGRLSLVHGDARKAVNLGKQALQALRKLGDEMGTLHTSEALLRALIAAGDLAGAIRLGPKVSDQAEKLEIREVRVRAIVLTGAALLRRGRYEPATRCFREIPELALTPFTSALMWRFGEALSSVSGQLNDILPRRTAWVTALKRLPEAQQELAKSLLTQFDLPPRERCLLKARGQSKLLNTEEIAWLDVSDYDLFVDLPQRRMLSKGQPIEGLTPELTRLVARLSVLAPLPASSAEVFRTYFGEEPPEKPDKKLKAPLLLLAKVLKPVAGLKVTVDKLTGVTLTFPKNYAILAPRHADFPGLEATQKKIIRQLRRFGTLPLNSIQQELKLNRSGTRRELGILVKAKLVETVRDGRGQAFRLL
jgi:tetratricopeptide (TPR) repeat protein